VPAERAAEEEEEEEEEEDGWMMVLSRLRPPIMCVDREALLVAP
jgi:hypothetical protein